MKFHLLMEAPLGPEDEDAALPPTGAEGASPPPGSESTSEVDVGDESGGDPGVGGMKPAGPQPEGGQMPLPDGGAAVSGDGSPAPQRQIKVSAEVVRRARENPFTLDFEHGKDDPKPKDIMAMDKPALKDLVDGTRTEMRQIEVSTDAGLYDNDRYQYLQARLKFLKTIIEA